MIRLIPWFIIAIMSIGMYDSVHILRQVNNPLGYELISHDEIEAMRSNLHKWKMTNFYWHRMYLRIKTGNC